MDIRKVFNYEQKEIEVHGKKYTLQNIPFKHLYQMQERCKDQNGNLLSSKMYDELFEKVIVSPKVTWDNFENIKEIEDLMTEVMRFLTGKKPFKDDAKADIRQKRED